MATIQIRDLPESAYETIRRRAGTDGKSIQSYMHDHVVAFASRRTKSEAIAEIRASLAASRWRLRGAVSFYDALYVALAAALALPLVTADARLARSAKLPCQVEVVAPR